MKTFRLLAVLISLAVCVPALTTLPGCQAPSTRVTQVQTLKAVGQSAEAAVAVSAQLYRDGRITAAQALQVNGFYDNKFIPVFRLAVAGVNANLDSVASPDVLALASQLSALVLQLQSQKITP